MPPPNWAPAPLSGGGRAEIDTNSTIPVEPGAQLGGPTLPQVTAQQFAPPRSRLPWLVGAVGIVVIGLIWLLVGLNGGGDPAANTSPTPSASPTQSAAPGQPYSSSDGSVTGRWEVLEHEWTSTGLDVKLRVSVDEGRLYTDFAAYGYQQNQATYPDPSSHQPNFSSESIDAGGAASGWVHFNVPEGECSIFLMDKMSGDQMSALTVPR